MNEILEDNTYRLIKQLNVRTFQISQHIKTDQMNEIKKKTIWKAKIYCRKVKKKILTYQKRQKIGKGHYKSKVKWNRQIRLETKRRTAVYNNTRIAWTSHENCKVVLRSSLSLHFLVEWWLLKSINKIGVFLILWHLEVSITLLLWKKNWIEI